MLKIENQHVFILCANHSGSTALYLLMSTSPNVSVIKSNGSILEGQIVPRVKSHMPYAKESDKGLFYLHKKTYKAFENYNWKEIKKEWFKHWDVKCPVLVEKSTTNLYRKNMLEENFYNSKFLIMVRNPYAMCESIKKKHHVDVKLAIKHWIDTTEQQIHNFNQNSLIFTYEQLCDNTKDIVLKIIDFVPKIVNLEYKSYLNRPRYESICGFKNMNSEQINKLSNKEIKSINKELEKNKEILDFFDYKII